MLLNSKAKRLAIFAYYDADGIVDDYIIYLLRAVSAVCEKQIVIINGTLTQTSAQKLKPFCSEIIYRANEGFDVSAYKQAFLSVDRAEAESYDEILFYNQTIFGPVYPLAEMFDAMATKDVDFWGLTSHKGAKKASWDNSVGIAPHVQSFFFVVRKSMFMADSFTKYWEELPKIETYWDAVGKHEVVFTKHFADLGFTWDTYIQTQELEKYNDYPLMGMPVGLIKLRRCPFFKRKNFLCSRYEYTNVPQGEATQALYNFIRTQTQYPIGLVLQNILRTADIATVTSALTPYYDTTSTARVISSVALVLWFDSDDLADSLCRAATLQRNAKLYCLFSSDTLKERYAPQLPATATCITITNNGAEYLFKTLWKEIVKYTYVGYLHNDLPLLLDEFFDATTLGTAVESLAGPGAAALLVQHPEIGVLIPPLQHHQNCYSVGLNWSTVVDTVRASLEKAGICVPMDTKKAGIASRGGMFFARVDAMAPLAQYDFKAQEFSGEYPAWEYFAPLSAQSKGFITAFACSQKTAYTLLANQTAYLNEINHLWATPNWKSSDQVFFRMRAIQDFYHERRFHMTLEQAFEAKLGLKQKVWICTRLLFPKLYALLHQITGKNKPEPEHIDPME